MRKPSVFLASAGVCVLVVLVLGGCSDPEPPVDGCGEMGAECGTDVGYGEDVGDGDSADADGDDEPLYRVELPVEIIPTDGRSAHATEVLFHVSEPEDAQVLYLQGHSLGYRFSMFAEGGIVDWDRGEGDRYDEKVSVRLNDGEWVLLSNENVECVHPYDKYGCVAGAFLTVRLNMALELLGEVVEGENRLGFRFNGTEGISSAVRILEFDLRREDGSSVIDETVFEKPDYSGWRAPEGYDNEEAVAAGEALWHQRGILKDGGMLSDPPEPRPINAACASCHATNGRDLKYFNYSNETIVARARFHDLTEEEGKQIAAYIRSIDLRLPEGYDENDTGRPWNPPYQPGSGIDDRPVELWAAGAGLDAVLVDDIDALALVREIVSEGKHYSRETINIREFPIAFQLPDWNHWLPLIALEDMIGMEVLEDEAYQELVVDLDNRLADPDQRQSLINSSNPCGRFVRGLYEALHSAYPENHELNVEQSEWAPDTFVEYHLGLFSRHLFSAVKLWHLHTEYKLEGLGQEIYKPGHCDDLTYLADYTWIGEGMQVFFAAPHMHTPGYYHQGPYRNRFQQNYFSSAWYELQLILNPGARGRRAAEGNPMDWNYHHPHVHSSAPQGHQQLVRFWRGYIYMLQARDGLVDPRINPNPLRRFNFRHTLPGGGGSGLVRNGDASGIPARGEELDDEILTELMETSVDAFLTLVERFELSEWPYCSEGPCSGDRHLEPPDYVPVRHYDMFRFADSWYAMMYDLERYDIAPEIVDRAARQGQRWWPLADWEPWILE